jgi:hypothetical protein
MDNDSKSSTAPHQRRGYAASGYLHLLAVPTKQDLSLYAQMRKFLSPFNSFGTKIS